jgi:hypothetical protein
MTRLDLLLTAARTLSPHIGVKFQGTEDENTWICMVSAGGVILFESKPGTIDNVIDQTIHKLQRISNTIRKALPPDDEGASGASSA